MYFGTPTRPSGQTVSTARYGVDCPNTTNDYGQATQFDQHLDCPDDGLFSGGTFCDTILK